jgi:hypothetical protein
MTSFPRGGLGGPAAPFADEMDEIWCWICGRPLRAGEEFGRWRLQAVRPSPRYGYELRAICPSHYGDGCGPPVPAEDKPPAAAGSE